MSSGGTTIRNLLVKVGIDTGSFQKGMTSLGNQLNSIGKNISKAGASLTKGLTMPIVGAAASLTALTVSSAASAKQLTNLSIKTGWNTTSLQEMQYAAKQAGFDFDKFGTAISRITKSVGAAQKAGQDYIKISDNLKVSIKDQNTGALKSNEQLMYDVIDALSSMTDETQRDIETQEIFGKSFIEMKPLIEQGSSGLKELAAQAEAAGIVLSDSTVKSLSDTSDSLETMKAQLQTAGSQIAAAFAPALQNIGPVVVNALKGVADAIAGLFKWFQNLSPFMQKFITMILGLAVAIGPLLSIVGGLTSGLAHMFIAIGNISKAISGGTGLLGIFKAATSSTGLMVAAIVAAVAVIGTLIIALSNTDPKFQKMKQNADDLKKSIDDMENSYSDSIDSINANAAAAQTLADKLYDLDSKTNKTNADREEERQLVDQLNKIYPDLNLSIDENTGKVTKNKQAIEDQISVMKKQAEATANSDLYKQALEKQYIAQKQSEDSKKAYQDYMAAHPSITEDMVKNGNEAVNIMDSITGHGSATLEGALKLYNVFKENQDSLRSLTTDANYYSAAMDGVNDTNKETIRSDSDATAARKTMLDMITAAEQKYMDQAEATTAADIKKQNGMKASEKEMVRETKLLNTYTANMQKLQGKDSGLSSGALKYLQSLGLNGAKLANELAKGSPEARKKFSDTYASYAQAGTNAAFNELGSDQTYNDAVKASQTIGKGAAKGIANGIKNNTNTITASLSDLLKGIAAGLKKVPLSVKITFSSSWTNPTINLGPQAKGGIIKHATGFITNGPTVINRDLIGEAGTEALLPLESNTGWMDMVADRLAARMGSLKVDFTVNTPVILDGTMIAQSQTKQTRILNLQNGAAV